MACGLPIVCYDHGGQTDFLRDQHTGYLIPLNNIALFKERCELLVSDAGLRQVMGAHNRRQVEEYYIDQCAKRYESLFERVLRG
jgi:glycosyltransferase involved in cell wall biosynthesis